MTNLNDTSELPQTKVCTKCRRELPATAEYFPRSKTHRFGVHAWCKACHAVAADEWRKRNSPYYGRVKDRRLRDGYRLCRQCNTEYPLTDEFWYWQSARNHYRSTCKTCVLQQNKQWRHDNQERMSELVKRWAIKNPEKARELQRRYRRQNPEKINEKGRRYRQRNPEKIRATRRRYRLLYPEKHKRTPAQQKEHNLKRRALLAKAEGTFSAGDWSRALAYFNGRCAVCERPLNDLFGTHTAAGDHWIPLSKGGNNDKFNIVPLCHGFDGCNNLKSWKMPEAWLIERFGKRKGKQVLRRIQAYFDSLKQGGR